MTIAEFKDTLSLPQPPAQMTKNLQALWFDANGNWDKAHEIVQETSGFEGDRIHAYLHRKEGDLGNASYWYSRVGQPRPTGRLEKEWEELANLLLQNV